MPFKKVTSWKEDIDKLCVLVLFSLVSWFSVCSPASWFSVCSCSQCDMVLCVSELDLRQTRGSVGPGTLLLTASDPEERLGSGGATLNALLVAAEHLSARAGHTVSSS